MEITVNIEMAESVELFARTELFEQSFDWTAVPRVGDIFLLDEEGGWSQSVDRVWWSHTGAVTVELGRCVDAQGENLRQALLDNGWKLHNHAR